MKMTHTITNITSEPFSNPHIRKILDRVINDVMYDTCGNGLIIDPFSRESFTRNLPNCITNDLNPEFNTDFNLEFKDFANTLQGSVHKTVNLVLFDPPYSLTQLKKQYDGIGKDLELWQTKNMWKEGKDILASMMPPGSYVVSLGWTTSGFGHRRGFEKKEIHLFEQQAREEQFTLSLVIEQKVQTSLYDYAVNIESE